MGLKDLNLDIIIGRLLQCKVDYQAIKLRANEANLENKHGLANSLNRDSADFLFILFPNIY